MRKMIIELVNVEANVNNFMRFVLFLQPNEFSLHSKNKQLRLARDTETIEKGCVRGGLGWRDLYVIGIEGPHIKRMQIVKGLRQKESYEFLK